MQRLARTLAALFAGLALLVLPVPPSGASAGTVNSGYLGISLTPFLNIDLTPGTGPCPALPPGLTLNATSGPANAAHVTLTFSDFDFTYAGGTFFLHGLTAHGTGTIDPLTTDLTVGPFTSVTFGNIYAETAPGSCVRGPALCGTGVRLNPLATQLNLTGTFPGGHTAAGGNLTGTAVIDGSGHLQAMGCRAPFTAVNNKVMSFTNTNVTFV